MTNSYLSLFGGITSPPWDNTWGAGQADEENLLMISGRNLINNFLSHIQPTFLSPEASVISLMVYRYHYYPMVLKVRPLAGQEPTLTDPLTRGPSK